MNYELILKTSKEIKDMLRTTTSISAVHSISIGLLSMATLEMQVDYNKLP